MSNFAAENPSFRIENIQPILMVKDISASRHFYVDLLGFKEAEWGNDSFTSFNRDNCGIYVCRDEQGCSATWVWIGFDGDINALYEKLKTHGAKIRMPPVNFSWALEMRVEDPDGHVLRFGTEPEVSQTRG